MGSGLSPGTQIILVKTGPSSIPGRLPASLHPQQLPNSAPPLVSKAVQCLEVAERIQAIADLPPSPNSTLIAPSSQKEMLKTLIRSRHPRA